MNRELQFRAWNTTRKAWTDFEYSIDSAAWREAGKMIPARDIILEQYTGQHDMHGAKIYEGDNLRYIGPSGKEVISNSKTVAWSGAGFNIKSGNNFEIAGNIHEGSEA